MLKSTASLPEDSESLAGTPFATMPDPPAGAPLKRTERLNVVFVLAASQLIADPGGGGGHRRDLPDSRA